MHTQAHTCVTLKRLTNNKCVSAWGCEFGGGVLVHSEKIYQTYSLLFIFIKNKNVEYLFNYNSTFYIPLKIFV